MLLIATVCSGQALLGYSSMTFAMILLLALVPQLIGHSSLNLAVRMMPVTIVSVAILGEPVIAIILGYTILGEGITVTEILGSALALGGILMVMIYKPKMEVLRL